MSNNDDANQDVVLFSSPRRNGQEELRVQINSYRGQRKPHVRVWYAGKDGEMRPSNSGVALSLDELPGVIAALQKALKELGG